MSRAERFWASVAVALLGLAPAHAVAVETWSATTAEQLGRGALDGTALDADGRIHLAATVRTIWGPEAGVVWALDAVGDDAAFVALSGPGRVLRVAAGREPETWFESAEETLVTAVVAEPEGVLFGVAPNGRVMRAHKRSTGPVQSEMVVETGAAFVWALARGRDGIVWIGTGMPGGLWRWDGSRKPELVFETGEDPVRAIAPLAAGGVVFGTGGRGRVLRVAGSAPPFVLLDADESEISAVAVAADGTIYALAAQKAKPLTPTRAGLDGDGAGEPGVARITVSANAPEGEPEEGPAELPPAGPARPPSRPGYSPPGGALYRIDPTGDVRRIWQTSDATPFDVLALESGEVLVATGDKGRVHTIDREGRSAQLLRVSSDQASVLASGPGGGVLVGGTTDARVEVVGPALRSEGSYETAPIDAGTVADWGRVRWAVEVPRGGRVRVEARAGNTAEPDATWSPWSPLASEDGSGGAESSVPAARWFQARFRLVSGRGAESPRLGRIEVFYQARNRTPVVTALTVEAPGIVWVRGPMQSSLPTGPVVADDPVARRLLAGVQPGRAQIGSIRKGYETGVRTFSWRVEDPDRDRLRYTVELRPESADVAYVLARDLEEEFFSWDARSVPDGTYRMRLTVDDALDNPNGTHRSTERSSDAFHVDNHRPGLGAPDIRSSADSWEVGFAAEDPGGQLAALEVAVDGGEWTPLSPADGVADSPVEHYRIVVPRDPGRAREARTLLVRVVDAAGNVGGELWKVGP